MSKIKQFFKFLGKFFVKLGASIWNLIKRLFVPHKYLDNENVNEALLSPSKQIFQRFIRNKLTIVGLIGFFFILFFSFGLALFIPLDLLHTNTFHRNLPPDYSYLDYPQALQNEGVLKVSSGAAFSIGLSHEGNIYIWGTDDRGVVSNVPAAVRQANIVDISAGSQHVMAMDDQGNTYLWGYNHFQQGQIADRFLNAFNLDPIVSLTGGFNRTIAITESGALYIWGVGAHNPGDILRNSPYTFVDGDDQIIKAVKVASNNNNILVLLENGTVGIRGVQSEVSTQLPANLVDGSINVIDIGLTTYSAFALDDTGVLHSWGGQGFGMTGNSVPVEARTNVKDIEDGYEHMVVLTNDGKVYAWGNNAVQQINVPDLSNISEIFVDAYQNYAKDENGNLHVWGNRGFLLGTDEQGRDFLAQLVYGGRVTLTVGAVAVLISLVIGIFVGTLAGYFGGWIDNILMRIAEIVSAFPFLPFAITLSALLIQTETSEIDRMLIIMVILGVLSWTGLARLIRGQILAEREKDYVLAAKALGLKEGNVIWKHVFPSVISVIIVNTTLAYAGSLLTEAGLSFLGFGVQKPSPSWGNILNAAQQVEVIRQYWWRWILPGLCIIIAALSINLIGDALRDAMDPKSDQ